MVPASGATKDANEPQTDQVVSANILDQGSEKAPRIWMIVLIAFVTIFFAIGWIFVWHTLSVDVWQSDFVEDNPLTVPLIVVVTSLSIGLCIKYLNAKTMMAGGPVDSMKGDKEVPTQFGKFWGTLISSILSLISGAAIGPEGPLALLVEDIGGWIAERLRMAKESRFGFVLAGLSSAYNGLIGSPVFTAIFVTEFHGSRGKSFKLLVWNLLAGVVGFFVYTMLGLKTFLGTQDIPSFTDERVIYLFYAVLLGLAGSLISIFAGVIFKAFEKLIRLFGERVVLRMFLVGVVTAIVVYFVPEIAFSGQEQIGDLIENPADYGIALLLFYAVLKIVMMALAFKSGYLGGPIFPVMFSCTAAALALSLIFPTVPMMILILCTEAAGITLLLSAPLTAILLTTVVSAVGGVNHPFMLGLIVVSTVTAMIVGPGVRKLIEQLGTQGGTAPRQVG